MITTGFGFESTAAQVAEGVDLAGTSAVVTGASSGIGIETARVLASSGAAVTLAVRDTAAGQRAAAGMQGDIRVAPLDLTDRASIDAFVAAWDAPLHVLVNNAGIMALPELTLTPAGRELQFATNHLGHFALALGLHDALAADGAARIVSLSSRGHLRSPVVFDDLDFAHREYEAFRAYGQSKTANVLFAVEATRRWAQDGITANAVHPGGIDTNLARHMDPADLERLRTSGTFKYKTVEQGAATSVLVATSPQLEGIGGRYFEDCNEGELLEGDDVSQRTHGVAAYAVDPANAERLWELSLELI